MVETQSLCLLSKRTPEALNIAARIDTLLARVIRLQRDHVQKCCVVCDEPCCKRVTDLFDEKDLIFAWVIGRYGAPKRRRKRKAPGCAYLSETGCTLEPRARPFTCHRYLCETLKKEMTRVDAGLVSELEQKFVILEDLRVRLWGAYLAF